MSISSFFTNLFSWFKKPATVVLSTDQQIQSVAAQAQAVIAALNPIVSAVMVIENVPTTTRTLVATLLTQATEITFAISSATTVPVAQTNVATLEKIINQTIDVVAAIPNLPKSISNNITLLQALLPPLEAALNALTGVVL